MKISDIPVGCLFRFVCLLGCCWHVYQVSALYLSYPTTVNIQIERPHHYEYPAITLCFRLRAMVNRTALGEQSPKMSQLLKYIQNLNETETTKEIRSLKSINAFMMNRAISFAKKDRLTYGFFEMFDDFRYYGQKTKSGTRTEFKKKIVANPEVYFLLGFKCFTVNDAPHEPLDRHFAEEHGFVNMASIEFGAYVPKFAILVIHDPKEKFSFDGNNWLPLNLASNSAYNIYFWKKTNKFLPAPYETNCTDYTQMSYVSRQDCIQRCLIRKLGRRGQWPLNVPAPVDLPSNLTVKGGTRGCPRDCGYSEDCEKGHFFVKSDTLAAEVDGKNKTDILIRLPSGIWMTYSHHPKLDRVEFLCYIGSAISLWFGASIIGIFTESPLAFVGKRCDKSKKVRPMSPTA